MGWSRRGALRAGVVGAVAGFSHVPWAWAQGEAGRVRLAAAHRAWPMNLPVVLAEHLGYFKQEGLDFEWLDLPTQSRVAQVVLSGSGLSPPSGAPATELALLPFEQVLQLQAGGLAARCLVLQGRSPQWVLGLASRAAWGPRG